MIDPFATETIVLRVPLRAGERTSVQLTVRPPKLKDLIRADAYPGNSVAYARALLSSLTGEPEIILDEIVPEDWADCLVVLNRAAQRFRGEINLFDQKEEPENPTGAAGPPGTLSKTSEESPQS
ncbi:MAG: phage tail assembly protein [Spirochaetales bacterium]|jgi:hypothetical protein|nr:phage tail assembly protein [Spirochaetales bacterium]